MENTVKIRFFTRIAYYLLASRQKYRNVFLVMAIFSVSLVMAVSAVLQLGGAFSSAAFISSLLAGNPGDGVLQKAAEQSWNAAWGKATAAGLWMCVMACCAIIEVKMVKIYYTFRQKGRAIRPLAKK